MIPYYQDDQVTLYLGDALDVAQELQSDSADCIVTSPPYFGLRDYGTDGQYGLEASPSLYVARIRRLFSELNRVLTAEGTMFLNLGDSYGPTKNLLGVPWRVAFALQDDGWILRNAIIWNKPNAMPESVTDRLSGRYEHVFLFSKSRKYWFDLDPIREASTDTNSSRARAIEAWDGTKPLRRGKLYDARPNEVKHQGVPGVGSTFLGSKDGRNPGDVWTIPTQPFSAAHFAVFPVQLPQRCILAGCKPGGTVLDPFSGSGTTGVAAQRTGRKYVGIDLNREYLELSLNHPQRLSGATLDFQEGA